MPVANMSNSMKLSREIAVRGDEIDRLQKEVADTIMKKEMYKKT